MPEPSPLDGVAWPIRTARLSIRPATIDDLESTWRFRKLDEVNHWITRAPQSLEAYRADFAVPEWLGRTLIIERDGEVIGDLMLKVGDAWSQAEVREQATDLQAELGWVLDPAEAGKGYASEAVLEVLRLCFEELAIRRVIAESFAANARSRRLMERVGMRCEAQLVRDSLHRSGVWMDSVSYAILADEWRAGRQ